MIPKLLKAVGLKKRYGNRYVVNGIDMEIQQNEVIAVIGPNGAGKSTMLDLILGLKKADEGTVEYWSAHYRSQVGVQLQSTPFFPGLSALENLQLFGAFYRKKLSAEEAVSLLQLCGLQEVAGTEASRLSGGQQKRLAIAVSVVHQPKLVFLDEPTAALDPKSRREIHNLIRKLAESGCTIVFTSHDMEEVHKLADRLMMIDAGRVVAEGKPEELCTAYQTENLEELYLKLMEEECAS